MRLPFPHPLLILVCSGHVESIGKVWIYRVRSPILLNSVQLNRAGNQYLSVPVRAGEFGLASMFDSPIPRQPDLSPHLG